MEALYLCKGDINAEIDERNMIGWTYEPLQALKSDDTGVTQQPRKDAEADAKAAQKKTGLKHEIMTMSEIDAFLEKNKALRLNYSEYESYTSAENVKKTLKAKESKDTPLITMNVSKVGESKRLNAEELYKFIGKKLTASQKKILSK